MDSSNADGNADFGRRIFYRDRFFLASVQVVITCFKFGRDGADEWQR